MQWFEVGRAFAWGQAIMATAQEKSEVWIIDLQQLGRFSKEGCLLQGMS